MFEITPMNVHEYLLEAGRLSPDNAVKVRELGWGVSNIVLRVDVEGEPAIVLKQARERLRVKAHWVSRIDRIWTEREALVLLDSVLPEGSVPHVLFSDEENYLFAMTCAPDDSVVWKEQLLAGHVDLDVGRQAGQVLGMIHESTRDHPALQGRLSNLSAFDELRIDPFYREIARVYPDVTPVIDHLIASMKNVEHPCLVLGDFSPKNILVHSRGLTLVDFETAHAGAPAYDLGFFLSHLMLKGLKKSDGDPDSDPLRQFIWLSDGFRDAYDGEADWSLVELHLYACMLARVDGKSPVDYLDEDERNGVRRLALYHLRRAFS